MTNIGDYLLAELMLWLIYIVVATVVVAMAVSVVRTLRLHQTSMAVSNRVPQRRLAWGVTVFAVALVVVACLLGSSSPMLINGISYDDTFWLKVSDGLIVSSVVLMIVAACFVAYGLSGANRRIDHHKKQ